tara:strand:+ start:960 stop:1307 length:348 start_codon:yes stop_codon:yes gene_type:complete
MISGVVASSINYIIYNFLYLISSNILLASVCGYFTGLLVSFIFAKVWVFQNKSKKTIIKSFSSFCLIYFLGGVEMSFVIIFLNQLINNYKIAWLFGAFIGSLNNYLGLKYVAFKK